MTSDLDSGARSVGDRTRARAYHRDFWPGVLAYAVVLVAVHIWGNLDADNPWRYLWAVLPAIPAAWVIRAVVRHVHRIDDFQRLLLLQGLAVGFAVGMIAALTVGFLGTAGLSLPGAGWIIYAAGMLGWGIGTLFGRRR